MNYRHASFVFHGPYGSGKSYIAATAPGPTLVLDCEGGVKDTDRRQIEWTDLSKPPPAHEKEDLVIVRCKKWVDVDSALQFLWAGETDFDSIVIDSLSEMQRQIIDAKVGFGGTPSDFRTWGELLSQQRHTIRKLRDQVDDPEHPINVLLVCSPDHTQDGQAIPLLQGAFRKELAGYVDMVAHITSDYDADGDFTQQMQIAPDDHAEAKCRLKAVRRKYKKYIPVKEDEMPIRTILKVLIDSEKKESN